MNHTWIICDKNTGQPLFEVSQDLSKNINSEKYVIKTALKYLGELNRKIKASAK